MKRIFAALMTMTLLLGLAAPAHAAKAKAAVMRLLVEEGGVSIRDAAGVPIYYHKDMRLYSGYTVSTDSDGSAYILLDDEKAVKLDRNTNVLIKKSGRKLQVKLKAGQLIFNVTAPLDSSEALEIRTSSMVIGIRGSSGVVTLREVIFVTGHGVVYSGDRSYALTGGTGFRPRTGVFTFGVASLPSIYLKEVRDNPQLKASIQSEGIFNTDNLIAGITGAELQEEEARREAREGMIRPPEKDAVIPAFGEDDGGTAGDEPEETQTYTITWINEGDTLLTETIGEGDTPAWAGDTPTKESDAQYTYTFDHWTPDPAPASEDTVYTAVYTQTTRSYTITWKDDAGNVINTASVPYGDTPAHAAPAKADTNTASYSFAGWVPQPKAVTGDATYTAAFEATYNFAAIIPQGGDNTPYQVFYPTEGNMPITTAKEGEVFTFYIGGTRGMDYAIRLNGVLLGEENAYFSKEMDAIICTFTVPQDPTIQIDPA